LRISKVEFRHFRRFTHLEILDIPREAQLVVLVGPNGSGKSSVFDGLNWWHRKTTRISHNWDESYYFKEGAQSKNWDETVEVHFHDAEPRNIEKSSMYFRTAYRNDPDFQIHSFSRVGAPYESPTFARAIDNDQSVSDNYQRLVHKTTAAMYDESNDDRTIGEVRHELIGKLQESMSRIFDDLVLNNIGDPLGEGTFTFRKGEVDSFPYKNLSSGEKAVFDLLLDLLVKLEYYPEALFFIEEPEAHIHTALQGPMLREMLNIMPDRSQLWITTHSLGIMRMAKELAQGSKEKVVFLDFADRDFDRHTKISPSSPDGLIWEKFLSLALGDFSVALAPNIVILCEGSLDGTRRKDFDAQIYRRIFQKDYPEIVFVSGGSCNELTDPAHKGYQLLRHVLPGTKIYRLVDRDDRTVEEVSELNSNGVIVTSRRNMESYLFDDEILRKLALHRNVDQKTIDDILDAKEHAIACSVKNGNPRDDIKSAASGIYTRIRKILDGERLGSNTDAFMRDTLAPLITSETNAFADMKHDIIDHVYGR
jgi:predicted ATPase